MNGTDRTGPINTREPLERHAHLQVHTRGANWSEYRSCFGGVHILRTSRTYLELEVRMAAPVRSYCFTVRTDLIGPAVLNGAPLKPDANAGM
jgi:hypothetical protein